MTPTTVLLDGNIYNRLDADLPTRSRLGLTLEVEHRLKAKGFDALYQSAPAKWIEMAANARQYCEKFITDNQPIRPGDISENLQNAIKTDAQFEAHMKLKKLTQKYFVRDFSDYILDQIYPSGIPKEVAKK